jgi:hypothetical protein
MLRAPDGTGPKLTWSGPPLMPKVGPERFHFHVAPAAPTSAADSLDHLTALGASRLATSLACPGAVALEDVDGNQFCLVEA